MTLRRALSVKIDTWKTLLMTFLMSKIIFSDPLVGRLIFIHHQCWEVLPFCRFQRQRCIKILCPKDPDFYTPLALKTAKGQHLPALVVYKNQSPTGTELSVANTHFTRRAGQCLWTGGKGEEESPRGLLWGNSGPFLASRSRLRLRGRRRKAKIFGNHPIRFFRPILSAQSCNLGGRKTAQEKNKFLGTEVPRNFSDQCSLDFANFLCLFSGRRSKSSQELCSWEHFFLILGGFSPCDNCPVGLSRMISHKPVFPARQRQARIGMGMTFHSKYGRECSMCHQEWTQCHWE